MLEWGWRLPFLSGILIGVFAIWIRNGLDESAEFEESNIRRSALGEQAAAEEGRLKTALKETPLWTSVQEHPIEIFVMFMVSGTFAVGVWVLTAFPPSLYQDLMDPPLGYSQGRREGGAVFDRSTSYIWLMHTCLCCVQICSIAFFGWLGDIVGNTRLMVSACALIAVFAVPCLGAMGLGSVLSESPSK